MSLEKGTASLIRAGIINLDNDTLLLIERRFTEFVDSFPGDDTLVRANLRLKRDHSFCVRDLADRILAELNPSPLMRNLSLCGALLHDTGRFPQFARYRTFHDANSVDHGELGAQILEQSIFRGVLTPDLSETLQQVVRHHNRKTLPEDMSPMILRILEVVRDADKLDILHIMTDHFLTADRIESSLVLHLPDTVGYTAEVYEAVMNGRTVNNNLRKNITDIKLSYLAWAFDLNHDISVRILYESDLIWRLASTLPDNMEINRVVEHVQGYCLERLGL